jgi:hypothetical protein
MSSLQGFNRVCKLKIQSVMLVFSTQLCELWPPNLLSGPPHPHSQSTVQYVQTVCGWEMVGGGSVELCWRPYSAGV